MDEAKLNLLIKVAVTELPPGADHTADTLCAIYHALVDGFNLEPEDVMRAMLRAWKHNLDNYVMVFTALATAFEERKETAEGSGSTP